MTQFVKLELDNNKSIFIEATEDVLIEKQEEGEVFASTEDRINNVTANLKEALSPVSGLVSAAVESIKDVAVAPDSIEVEFGLKFSADANVIVSKVSGEVTLKIKAVWKNNDK